MSDEFSLDPSGIAEFIERGSCPRYAFLRYNGDEEKQRKQWEEAFTGLDPLLAEAGNQFESDVYEILKSKVDSPPVQNWKDTEDGRDENAERIAQTILEVHNNPDDGPKIILQAPLSGRIGAFDVSGDTDIIIIWPPDTSNPVNVRVYDIKASWNEKTYHQIQTSVYSELLRQCITGRISIEYMLTSGVITRETDLTSFTPESLPVFDPTPRISDVERVLSADGPVADALSSTLDTVSYRHGSPCYTCPYNESCYTTSVEARDIRLLELSRTEQDVLRKHGIETIVDLAKIIEPVDKPRPYEYGSLQLRDEYRDVVQAIQESHSVGERLPTLAQKAQVMLKDLAPDEPEAQWPQWIVGSGPGNLPEDDPQNRDPNMGRKSLIRVYLTVQKDYIWDRVALLGARVACSKVPDKVWTVSQTVQQINKDGSNYDVHEKELLQTFFEELFETIKLVSKEANNSLQSPVHFYTYTQTEQTALTEASKRHGSVEVIHAMRDLLGLRDGIDQPMFSSLQPEITSRYAVRTHSTGLIPVSDQLSAPPWLSDVEKMDFSDWVYTRKSGELISLRRAFYYQLFNYTVPVNVKQDKITVEPNGSKSKKHGVRARYDASIPLEYLWAAEGIDTFDASWGKQDKYQHIIERFRWTDNNHQTRITVEDVEALAEKFCHALHSLERSLSYRNTDIEKPDIDISEIDTFSLGTSSLVRGCKEYLKLEYGSTKKDALSHYRKTPRQRILSGRSIPILITSNPYREGPFLKMEGRLIFESFDLTSPSRVAAATKVKSGDYMVATPLTKDGDEYVDDVDYPEWKLNSPTVTIEHLDVNSNEIKLKSYIGGKGAISDYETWHKTLTPDSKTEDNKVYCDFGLAFILDEQVDDFSAGRTEMALDAAEGGELHSRLTNLLNGTVTKPTTSQYDESLMQEYTRWVENEYVPQPNPEQLKFITETEASIQLLQGPPGTGKTSGASALSIVGRLHNFEKQGKSLRGLVTGASHKSIDEMLEDVSSALHAYKTDSSTTGLSEVLLARIGGDIPDTPLEGVKYVNPREDTDEMLKLERTLTSSSKSRQTGLGAFSQSDVPHVIVFVTPQSVNTLVNRLVEDSIEDALEQQLELFDVLAIDEASMLPLPYFFSAGAFLASDSQILVSGDHRQMPPVRKHEWKSETRRTIEETLPYMSTLDTLRFIRGDDVELLTDDEVVTQPNADIPLVQLQETYRCHTNIAAFLRRWVYQKDGIEYTSEQTTTLPVVSGKTEGIDATLSPSGPLTVILHDDEQSRQSNLIEAAISQELAETISRDQSVGVVTPHNAQKGLLSSMLPPHTQVDTVERFQGGQRDAMIISATVSDPDALHAESDFLLSPNRITVALSRMKKKLIVLVPKSLLRLIPSDVDEYEDSIIWKGLYSDVCQGEPVWNGTLTDYLGNEVDGVEYDVNIEVYSDSPEDKTSS